ncbi:MAG TPA: class I adenylate-forming enzyme family protein [Elusimicrobiota bacterium]|nr:class I adenylate-forming enzyme family protein [Elusimicrobiota bacterium]
MNFIGNLGPLIDGKTGEVHEGGALKSRIRRRAAELAVEGILGGDRVALAYGNSPELLIDLLALWERHACAIPLDPGLPASEVERVLQHAEARMLLSPGRTQRLRDSSRREAGEALILYTSGTTALPKGIVHTFEGLASKFRALTENIEAASWKTVLCLLPMHFGHGLICNCLWPWLASRGLVLFPSNDLEVFSRLGEAVDRYRADFFSTVPSIWRWVLHTGAAAPRMKTLKRVHCASAPLDEPLWEQANAWTAGAPVVNVYGTTETAGWIAGTAPGERPEDGSVGGGWGCEFQVREAREGVGEVWARTDALMKGYLGRPEMTAAVLRAGWYRTGDLGRLDDRGRLHLRGRLDDVINKAGLKIYPDDVEEVLKQCAGVADVCVFGEPHPLFGEEVAAAVVLKGDALSRVQSWCDGKLAGFKIPRKWYPLKEIPRNERGKVSRRRVLELCRG